MRTTLRIDEQLLRDVKVVATESGRTITAVIEDLLRESLARRRQAPAKKRVTLPTFDGGGLMPGVDINNSAALLDIMEEGDRDA
jgi:hypothetical protein